MLSRVMQQSHLNIELDERRLSIIVFSLLFSWVLTLPFEGQILSSLANQYGLEPYSITVDGIVAQFVGLFACHYLIKTMRAAKRLLMLAILFCIICSSVFFFPPGFLWYVALITGSFLSGACVAAWGFYLKSGTPSNRRIKTTAEGLIYSNILMVLLNVIAVNLSPDIALGLSMILLCAAIFFSAQLPVADGPAIPQQPGKDKTEVSLLKPFVFLYIFIMIITINSGLMYRVINPAFAKFDWLVSWYWAIPYIVALYIMKDLPRKINRSYILYVAIAMIGLTFIAFMSLDHTPASYLLIDTLMLGACGVCDLFWWSILGEMLDLDKNPSKILGVGLSANVLGVLIGDLIGNNLFALDSSGNNQPFLALLIVFVILIILPVLNKKLSELLDNHAFLSKLAEVPPVETTQTKTTMLAIDQLTSRENEIAMLLLRGRTYKMIAEELCLSENTIKTHIKNIYSKLNIQSKSELITLLADKEPPFSM